MRKRGQHALPAAARVEDGVEARHEAARAAPPRAAPRTALRRAPASRAGRRRAGRGRRTAARGRAPRRAAFRSRPGRGGSVRVPSDATSATVADVGASSSRTRARRSTPRSSSSSTTKSPNRSAPTLPATPACSPSRASALAVFSAQPPPWSSISPARPSVPRAGSSSTGRQMTSATRIPRQTTSMLRSSHAPPNVVRLRASGSAHTTRRFHDARRKGGARSPARAAASAPRSRASSTSAASGSGSLRGAATISASTPSRSRCDVRELEQLESIVAATVERFGRLDILVANAGVGAYGPFLDLSREHLDEMIDVNLKGTLYAVRAALPHLVESGAADIVTVASEAGRRGLPFEATYCASKFGQVGFTRALDHELREHGVRCTNVCPGGVATDFALDEGRGRYAGGAAGDDDRRRRRGGRPLRPHAAAEPPDPRDRVPPGHGGVLGVEQRAFWAPGRVNLIGEYTDLVGGLVLPVALDLGIRVECVAAETDVARVGRAAGRRRLAAVRHGRRGRARRAREAARRDRGNRAVEPPDRRRPLVVGGARGRGRDGSVRGRRVRGRAARPRAGAAARRASCRRRPERDHGSGRVAPRPGRARAPARHGHARVRARAAAAEARAPRRGVGRLAAARVVRVRRPAPRARGGSPRHASGTSRRRTSACARSSRSCASRDSRGSRSSGASSPRATRAFATTSR